MRAGVVAQLFINIDTLDQCLLHLSMKETLELAKKLGHKFTIDKLCQSIPNFFLRHLNGGKFIMLSSTDFRFASRRYAIHND